MIQKLLVANRGEIARRVMRSAHSMGISCVAICSDADVHAPHVMEADEVVRLPGSTPLETYLHVDAIVAAGLAAGADAVHPGYGFLSENAGFAQACTDAGMTFVGPPSEVIEAMGSKLAAKAMMAAAGVPVLPTVEVPAAVIEAMSNPGSGHARDSATPTTGLATVMADLERTELDWPVLVKASAGGGGRGMRVVNSPEALADALAGASREAAAAFGDGTVFIEPYAERPRHIEVQILGDNYGNVVHLFERECSIQRRHQKIVEECPSPALDTAMRADLGEIALTAARAIGYVGAGTVEFLMMPGGRFAFLEVNTRLQVEHPVTEAVTGLDLVRLQLLIAQGDHLPEEARHPTMNGHAIEVRLYAEDPSLGWRPSAGRIERFDIPGLPFAVPSPGSPGIRVDSGVENQSVVSPHYDPMLAKVIAHAPTRAEAARLLSHGLERARLHGVTTNRDLLVRILRHPEFLAGQIDTGFLVRHDPSSPGDPATGSDSIGSPLASRRTELLHAVAAAMATQAERRQEACVLAGLPSGWRNNPSQLQTCVYDARGGRIEVGYRFDRTGRCAELAIDGTTLADIEVIEASPSSVVIRSGGLQQVLWTHTVGSSIWVDGPGGSSHFDEVERFALPGSSASAGSLLAPLPGTVVRVTAEVGHTVESGAVLLAIEAMKMEHEVRSPSAGKVTAIHVSPGDQVEAGRVLAVIEDLGGS
jgi:acetyl/propionyl-CoA carboxylase alpha subunit